MICLDLGRKKCEEMALSLGEDKQCNGHNPGLWPGLHFPVTLGSPMFVF